VTESGQPSLVVKVEVTLDPSALAVVTEVLSNLASRPGVELVRAEIPSTTLTLSSSPQQSDSKHVADGDSGPDVRNGLVCGECHGLRFHCHGCPHGAGVVTGDHVAA
jgi:hypothetical protein